MAVVIQRVVRESTIAGAGLGLFATCRIGSGHVITDYEGVRRHVSDLPNPPDETCSHCLRIPETDWVIDGKLTQTSDCQVGPFANSSVGTGRAPNACYGVWHLDKLPSEHCKMMVCATRVIEEGEEILVKYKVI